MIVCIAKMIWGGEPSLKLWDKLSGKDATFIKSDDGWMECFDFECDGETIVSETACSPFMSAHLDALWDDVPKDA